MAINVFPFEVKEVTICPCCGFKFEGTLKEGCVSCGARAVGEALPKPDRELPSFGRSLVVAVTGSIMALVFLTQTFIAAAQRAPGGASRLALSSFVPLDFWSWVAAGETAAWRLKWIAIPLTIIALWSSLKLYRSILKTPARFCGQGYAKGGLIASIMVPVLIAVLIGVTVPERLQQRQEGLEAAANALAHRVARAQMEYYARYGTLPADLKDLDRLPDLDGSIAAALRSLDASTYKPSADLAALPKQKSRTLRGALLRNASLNTATEDLPGEGLSFTNYELTLPGADKLMGTEDDIIVSDGLVMKASEARSPRKNRPTKSTKP